MVVAALTFLSPAHALAQSVDFSALSSLGQGGLSMTVSPQYPAPGTNVSFTLQDYQDDLNVATIVWTVNGTRQASGVGQASFQMTTGTTGSHSTVTATVTTTKGAVITQSATIVPAGVDLLWQAHSYVPPFYLGKALFPFQGTITVTAMPTFALTNPKNAVYTWQLDGGAMPDVSGSGKNTITLTGSILLKPINLSVTARSADGSLTAQNSITLTGTNPNVILYQESPLYGTLLNKALGSALSLAGQTGFNATPYFFDSTSPYTNTATFQWSINSTSVTSQTGQVLVVAPPANQSGTSSVAVTATNSAKPFQTGNVGVSVGFTAVSQ